MHDNSHHQPTILHTYNWKIFSVIVVKNALTVEYLRALSYDTALDAQVRLTFPTRVSLSLTISVDYEIKLYCILVLVRFYRDNKYK